MKTLHIAHMGVCVLLVSVFSFAVALQPDEHDPSSTVTYDECDRAFACDFTFEGVDRLGNFSMDVHRKTVFTPPIRSYNPNHHVSYVSTSEKTESYECTGNGSSRSCGFKYFYYQSYDWGPMWLFAPELYDGMAISGIAPEVVSGINREQARHRCIRVRFNTIYMLNDDWRPTGVDITHAVDDNIWNKDNKCVMFLVH
eukprot:TRINITY_DN434_c1_g1_i1.p1 TRINITY_DN434_c1_g1~~TRINITY_DN434_c1_g1_i1.p1  ORF type:complete len:215 (+),score=15.14 TRINITY_DN434_c1_g1_i1:54-647(+)